MTPHVTVGACISSTDIQLSGATGTTLAQYATWKTGNVCGRLDNTVLYFESMSIEQQRFANEWYEMSGKTCGKFGFADSAPCLPIPAVWMPSWFAIAFPMLPLAVSIVAHKIPRHHAPTSRCRSCGYDLRATPARCPECGIVPTK